MLCVSPADAKRELQNKAGVHRWMGQANSLIDYYESRDADSKAAPSQ